MTPEQRRLRARIAANARWSRPMARADQAAAARTAIYHRLEREVDPTGMIPPVERDLMVRAAARRLSATLNVAKARKREAKPFIGHCNPSPTPMSEKVSIGALRTAVVVTTQNPPGGDAPDHPVVDTVRVCFAALETAAAGKEESS